MKEGFFVLVAVLRQFMKKLIMVIKLLVINVTGLSIWSIRILNITYMFEVCYLYFRKEVMEKIRDHKISAIIFSWDRQMMAYDNIYVVQDKNNTIFAIIIIEKSEILDRFEDLTYEQLVRLGFRNVVEAKIDFNKRYKEFKDIYYIQFRIGEVF